MPSFHNLALLTDLYELTMGASYYKFKPKCLACFDLFIRNLPTERSFFLAAGLADAIHFLNTFRFKEDDIQYLKSLKLFDHHYLEFLRRLKFSGDLWAIPEGTVFFPNEPVIRVVAPLIEAQLLESFLLNIVNLQTTIATKAARVVLAAKGKNIFDFSLRRTHGSEAAIKAARCAYLAGFAGTSNVFAGREYGIPVAGTMAHSFVMSFDNELSSFRAFVDTFPKNATLLVDTYDTIKGIGHAMIVARELEKRGRRLAAIRLDSGDLVKLSKKARALLNQSGFSYIKIFASGNLDEYEIHKLIEKSAPIDSFGVGTKMGVSADAPYCDVIYKLTEITNGRGEFLPTMKLSKGKLTFPGRKQIFRIAGRKGIYNKDILGLEGEKLKGKSLLMKIFEKGNLVCHQPELKSIRKFAAYNLSCLPTSLTRLHPAASYPVVISPKLKALTARVTQKIKTQRQQ